MTVVFRCPRCASRLILNEPFPWPGHELACRCGQRMHILYGSDALGQLRTHNSRYVGHNERPEIRYHESDRAPPAGAIPPDTSTAESARSGPRNGAPDPLTPLVLAEIEWRSSTNARPPAAPVPVLAAGISRSPVAAPRVQAPAMAPSAPRRVEPPAGKSESAFGLLDRPSRHLVIGFFGEFNAGKSSLLNSLLDSTVQAVDLQPTTASICAIVEPGDRTVRIEGAQRVEVRSPWVRWGVQLWDTPGWNAEDASHAAWAERAAREIDAAVYVLDATKAIHRSDVEQFKLVLSGLTARGAPAPLLALSHFDRFVPESDEDERDLLDDVRRHLGVEPDWVYRIHARDLERFDGARLRDDLLRLIIADRTSRFATEVAREPRHPLRARVATRENWRGVVDPELVSEPLVTMLAFWDEHCKTARRALLRERFYAIIGFPREAFETALVAYAQRIERHDLGWAGLAAGERARAILLARARELAHRIWTNLDPSKLLSQYSAEFNEDNVGAFVGALVVMGGLAIGTGGLALILLIPVIAMAGFMLIAAAVGFIAALTVGPVLLGLLWGGYTVALVSNVVSHRVAGWAVRAPMGAMVLIRVLLAPVSVWLIPGRLRRAKAAFLGVTGQGPPVPVIEPAQGLPARRAPLRAGRGPALEAESLLAGPLHSLPCMRLTWAGIVAAVGVFLMSRVAT